MRVNVAPAPSPTSARRKWRAAPWVHEDKRTAAGYVTRRPLVEDAREIHELISLCDTRVIGKADMTLDDVTDELNEPSFDRETDGWVVHDEAGRLVAWAWAYRKGSSDNVNIDVVVHPDAPGLTGWLWDTVTERARRSSRSSATTGPWWTSASTGRTVASAPSPPPADSAP